MVMSIRCNGVNETINFPQHAISSLRQLETLGCGGISTRFASICSLVANSCIGLHPVAVSDRRMPRAEELGLAGFSSGLMGFLVRWCNGSTEVFRALSNGTKPRQTHKQHDYSITTQTSTQITAQTRSKPST